jgi:hypothetical protein
MTAGVPCVSARTTGQCHVTLMRKDEMRALPWKTSDLMESVASPSKSAGTRPLGGDSPPGTT